MNIECFRLYLFWLIESYQGELRNLAEEQLHQLHSKIWDNNRSKHMFPWGAPCPGADFRNPNKIRDLTLEEFDLIISYVQTFGFPVTVISSFGGASFNFKIYSNHGLPAKRLLSVESSQFPGNKDRTIDDEVYEVIYHLVFTEKNFELIKNQKSIERPAPRSACSW